MTGKEIIRAIMEQKNKSNAEFANDLGISQQALWDRLNNKKAKDLSLNVFDTMVRSLGYSVYVVPFSKGQKLPEGAIKVGASK